MSPEEQNLISGLFDRIRPATATPRDREAEALIERSIRAEPAAPYYLVQAVIVQEKGLEAAASRIQDLEARLHASEERLRALEADGARSPRETRSGSFLGTLFGASEQPPSRPETTAGPWGSAPRSTYPAPQPAPAYPQPASGAQWSGQPQFQPQQSAGGGFLRGAMGTAAGVAGGMLLAHSLSGIFGNHMSSLGLGSAVETTAPVEETVINNYYGDDAATKAGDDTPTDAGQPDDGWQQADLDTGGDDGFDGDIGNDDTLDA